MYGNLWQRPKRPKVELLPQRLVRIIWASGYKRGETLDFPDYVFRQQQLAEDFQVKPSMGCVAERTIVQIETVSIDTCGQISLPEMQKPPMKGGLAPGHRSDRGMGKCYSFPGSIRSVSPSPAMHGAALGPVISVGEGHFPGVIQVVLDPLIGFRQAEFINYRCQQDCVASTRQLE